MSNLKWYTRTSKMYTRTAEMMVCILRVSICICRQEGRACIYLYVCVCVTLLAVLFGTFSQNRLNLYTNLSNVHILFASLYFVAAIFVFGFMWSFFFCYPSFSPSLTTHTHTLGAKIHSKSRIRFQQHTWLACVSPLGCHSIRLKLIHFHHCVLSTATQSHNRQVNIASM